MSEYQTAGPLFAESCTICGEIFVAPIHAITGGLSSWHVYEHHHEVWVRLIGNRPPADPDPRVPVVRARLLAEAGLQ